MPDLDNPCSICAIDAVRTADWSPDIPLVDTRCRIPRPGPANGQSVHSPRGWAVAPGALRAGGAVLRLWAQERPRPANPELRARGRDGCCRVAAPAGARGLRRVRE